MARCGKVGARFISQRLDERGTATNEYALLAGLIAIALVLSLNRAGGDVGNGRNTVDTSMRDYIELETE